MSHDEKRMSTSGGMSPFPWSSCLPFLLAVCVAGLTACMAKKEDVKKGPPPVLVVTAEVVKKDTPRYLEGIGRVRALKSVSVKPRVTGLLAKKHFKAGQFVESGQKLFTIDPAPFEAKLRETEAKVQGSKAELEQAEKDVQRFEKLYSEKTVSPEQYEQKLLDVKTKRFLLKLREAERDTAVLNLSYCSIDSPLNGQTGDVLIDEGNTVTGYQDALVTVKQVKPVKVEFSLPERFLPEIRKRYEQMELEVSAHGTTEGPPEIGRLTLIDNTINPKTGMILLEATFPNLETRLWPGQFVNVRLKLEMTIGAILVPSRAVNDGTEGPCVWIVKQDQTAEIRPVTVDGRAGTFQVIASGLAKGERVVVEGQVTLYPGARVTIAKPRSEESSKGRGR